MRNGTAFDPCAARAAYDRQILGVFGWLLVAVIALGSLIYGVCWVVNLPRTAKRLMFDTAPAVSKGCLDNPLVKMYRTMDLVDLYTTGGGELCAWTDVRNEIHIVTDHRHVLDQREGYLRQLYQGKTFWCEQPAKKLFFGGKERQPLKEQGWKIKRNDWSVCVFACGEEAVDCGDDRYVLRGTGDAPSYQDALQRLIVAGQTPVARQ